MSINLLNICLLNRLNMPGNKIPIKKQSDMKTFVMDFKDIHKNLQFKV